MSIFNNRYIAISIISLVTIFLNSINFPSNVLSWDVFGYYLYLPQTFIYDDISLSNIDVINNIIGQYKNTPTLYQIIPVDGGNVIKYTSGFSILFSPFFFLGHFIAKISHYPADGFSLPYQVTIWMGGIFYTLVGFIYLFKLLSKIFSVRIANIALLLLFFGTNFLFHSSFHGQNTMPHNYIFSLYTILLWNTYQWHNNRHLKNILFMGGVSGLIILSRPSEIVCLLIPLLWGISNTSTFYNKIRLVKSKYLHLLLFSGLILFIGSIQLLYWKKVTGSFIFYSYGGNPGEGFNFFSPNILDVLFSFRKGWLIYTPIMVFSLIGIYYIFKFKREYFLPVCVFFVINFYIVSSWSSWWYADSFGQRSLIPSYAILSIPFSSFLKSFLERTVLVKTIIGCLITITFLLNIFQMWQYNNGIIHSSRMTKEAYFNVFLTTKKENVNENLLLVK